MEEIFLKYMSYEAGDRIERSSGSSNLPVVTGKISSRQPLISTPYDYFCLKTLVDGRLSDGREGLTLRQNRIFEALKDMNLSYIKGSTFPDGKPLETLEDPGNIRGWADIRQILSKVNEGQDDKFSKGTLDKEMEVLIEKSVIQRSKVGNNPVKYVYAIKTLEAESSFVKLPNPRDLDLTSPGPIRGRNPVTGKVEEI